VQIKQPNGLFAKLAKAMKIYLKMEKMKDSNYGRFWVNEDQEVMTYEDPDENMARNAVSALRQARERNDRAMSIVSSNSRTSNASSVLGLMFTDSTQISETSSTSSHVSKVKQSKTKKTNYVLDTYVVRPLTTSQQYEFNRLILRLIIQNGLALRFVEKKLEQAKVFALSKSQEPVTIIFDGWKNVRCQEILGAVILSATNQLYIWGAEDISNRSQKTPNVLNKINAFFDRASNQNLNVVAMVTDSASVYASARLISVSDIFKLSSEYKQTVRDAVTITSYFNDKRHSKAISLLRDEQQRIYKKIYSFVLPVATRWNSYYYCFATLLRSKRALQSYSILYPNSFKSLDKSQNVIDDIQFWIHLEELVKHLLPFVSILDYLQHDAANLFDVAYAFGYIAQQYEDKLEKRWADWEQPLLILAVIFYPQYRTQALSNHSFFSLERITCWIEYYYEMWFGVKPKCVALELTEYYMKRGIFGNEWFENTIEVISKEGMSMNNAVGLTLLRYWEFAAIDQKEIGKVALRLYSIKINSAPCECLFFRMGWFQSPRRNRLKLQTIFRMTQIAAEMAWEEHLDSAEKVRQTVIKNL
ncbi:11922_t:CDS:2, partial [Dentiscutata erythropus]